MILDSLKNCRDRKTLLLNIFSISINEDDYLQRTPRDLSSHKQHIKVFRDQFRNDLNIKTFVLRYLKITEKQTTFLKFYIWDLNNCQRTFVKRNNLERFAKIVIYFNKIIIVRDFCKLHFTRLNKESKKMKNKVKHKITKAFKNSFNAIYYDE